MLYRLIKLDAAWRAAWGMTFLLPIMCFGYTHSIENHDRYYMVLPIFLWCCIVRKSFIYPASTLLEASLPIHGRQILYARIMARTALIWLPIGMVAATRPLYWGPGTEAAVRITLETGVALTLGLLSYSCLRAGKILLGEPNQFMQYAVLTLCFAIGTFVLPLLPDMAVVAILIAGSGALVTYIAVSAPPSFPLVADAQYPLATYSLSNRQVTQKETGSNPMADISSTPPERTQLWWGPILRMILPLTFLRGLEVFLFVLLIAGETTWWVILLFVSALLCHIHNRSHWLFTLPVSRSKLFAFLLLPLLLLTSVLYIIHTFVFSLIRHTQDADPRIVMITIAVFAALQLLVIIGVHCAWWRGVGRTLRTTVAALCFLISAALLVPWYSWMSKLSIGSYRFHFERSTFQFALGWLSDTLPGNPWASAGIVVVFLSMLYWCASRQFCQLEVSRIRMTA